MQRENKFKVAKIRISVKLQWGIILTKTYLKKKKISNLNYYHRGLELTRIKGGGVNL